MLQKVHPTGMNGGRHYFYTIRFDHLPILPLLAHPNFVIIGISVMQSRKRTRLKELQRPTVELPDSTYLA